MFATTKRSVGEGWVEGTLVEIDEKEAEQTWCDCALCLRKGKEKMRKRLPGVCKCMHKGVKRQERPSLNGQGCSEVERSYCKCGDCRQRVARDEERCKKSCKHCQETIHREQRWAGKCPPECLQCKKIEVTCCYCERCEQMEVTGRKRQHRLPRVQGYYTQQPTKKKEMSAQFQTVRGVEDNILRL